jgi:predicted solute-binding protein
MNNEIKKVIKDIETISKVVMTEHKQGLRVSAKLYQAVKCLEDAMNIPTNSIYNQEDILHD